MNSDEYITLSQANLLLPIKLSVGTLWKWCRHGIRSKSGTRIRLRHSRFGGRIYTKAVWVEEFGERLAAADQVAEIDDNDVPATETHAKATAELRAAGLIR